MIAFSLWSEGHDFAALSLLAIIQGLTEFLPISSSGHLVLAQSAMGFTEPALGLDVALHVGTLVAIAVVYRRDLAELVRRTLAGDLAELLTLFVGTLPAAVVGLVFLEDFRELFHRPTVAATGLMATAGILLLAEWARRRGQAGSDRAITWPQALVIGAAQALAIFPGISRSGITIAAGLLLGVTPEKAARFSFLLAIPVILGAAVVQLSDVGENGLGEGILPILWASAFAGFIGWGALRVLLAFLGRGAFAWFAAYLIGLATGALLFA